MATSAPASSTLTTSAAVWTPVEAASEIPQRRCRMAIQRSGRRSSAEVLSSSAGSDLHGLDVQVGLVEAVEQDQPVGAGLDQLSGQVGQGAEVRAELDRQGDPDGSADLPDHVQVVPLDLAAAQPGPRGHVVDVELQGVGPGLLERAAWRTQPPREAPLRLAITGIGRAALACSTSDR